MSKGRMEAFSDGVLAIILTIMVLELEVPHGANPADLLPLLPIFLSYVLSFVYIGIYWNNHHHLLQATKQVDGRSLWANMHLLFWLSLIPFATAWMGENEFATWPVALYGVVLCCAGTAYYLLTRSLIARHGPESVLARSIGQDRKGVASMVVYFIALPLSFLSPLLASLLYAVVAIMWLIPDPRIERNLVS